MLFFSVLCLLFLCARLFMCLVVTCWGRADLLALVCCSVCRCVIPCAFFGKSVNIHFLVQKCILFKKKYVYIFFLAF